MLSNLEMRILSPVLHYEAGGLGGTISTASGVHPTCAHAVIQDTNSPVNRAALSTQEETKAPLCLNHPHSGAALSLDSALRIGTEASTGPHMKVQRLCVSGVALEFSPPTPEPTPNIVGTRSQDLPLGPASPRVLCSLHSRNSLSGKGRCPKSCRSEFACYHLESVFKEDVLLNIIYA